MRTKNSCIVRPEKPEDCEAVHNVIAAAFLNEPHSDQTEPQIVRALRDAAVLSISLVALRGRRILGHVAVSPVEISDGASKWYGLGPIAVLPSEQGQGIGTQMMREAIVAMKELEAKGCVLLGDPNYYGRFGFEARSELTFLDIPPEYFQALSFTGEYARGEVSYHAAFFQ